MGYCDSERAYFVAPDQFHLHSSTIHLNLCGNIRNMGWDNYLDMRYAYDCMSYYVNTTQALLIVFEPTVNCLSLSRISY